MAVASVTATATVSDGKGNSNNNSNSLWGGKLDSGVWAACRDAIMFVHLMPVRFASLCSESHFANGGHDMSLFSPAAEQRLPMAHQAALPTVRSVETMVMQATRWSHMQHKKNNQPCSASRHVAQSNLP